MCCICEKTVTRSPLGCTILIHKGIIREWGDNRLLDPDQFLWAHRSCVCDLNPLSKYVLEEV